MTVKELIKILEQYPKDATVEILTVCGYESPGGEISEVSLRKDGVVEIFGGVA